MREVNLYVDTPDFESPPRITGGRDEEPLEESSKLNVEEKK